MRNDTLIAVDLAKTVFELGIAHRPGRIDERRRLPREQFLGFFVNRPSATVVMEACGSAHSWARKIQQLGHTVVLLPPRQVRPYVVGNKTDRADVKGMLEAYRNEDIRRVPIKTIEQQTLTSLHRIRSAWVVERTAKANTLRGLLRELGLIINVGVQKVVPAVRLFVEDADSGIPDALRPFFAELCDEIKDLDRRIKLAECQLEVLAQQSPAVECLRTIPGVGLLTATAILAFVGDIHRFPSARHFASYLGLTPREYSSGLKRNLGRISKRGDGYLRTLLIHGARSVLVHARKQQPDRLREWANQLATTRVHNKAAVAVANKLARIVWAVWKHERPFALMARAA